MIATIRKSAGTSVVVIGAEDQARSIEELTLSVRSRNSLRAAKINTLGELVLKTEAELLKEPNLGRSSPSEIKEILASLGWSLGMIYDTDGNLVKRA